jgi:uncharacterized protein YecE (DUF72 family)
MTDPLMAATVPAQALSSRPATPSRDYLRRVIFVGTSGWQYRDWRGPFYPDKLPQREWLPFYAGRFATTELNNSFYRLPEVTSFVRWREATPDGFAMAVKASRFLTHIRRLREPEEPLELFWSRAEALGPRLGPVLFQLPPRFPVAADRLEELLSHLPARMQAAFEFRDVSWHTPEVYGLLEAKNAALVWADRPGARVQLPLTADWAYLRFHQGLPDAAGYRRDKLARWADRIAALPVRTAWVYFNNDPGAAAIRDANVMVELLVRRGADVATPSRSDPTR